MFTTWIFFTCTHVPCSIPPLSLPSSSGKKNEQTNKKNVVPVEEWDSGRGFMIDSFWYWKIKDDASTYTCMYKKEILVTYHSALAHSGTQIKVSGKSNYNTKSHWFPPFRGNISGNTGTGLCKKKIVNGAGKRLPKWTKFKLWNIHYPKELMTSRKSFL